jgi:hypothetical protein
VSGEWFELDESDVMTFELECQNWHQVWEDLTKNTTWILPKK